MTKKKNIFVKLFVALVALTLISCCFLGSTFARYTSGGKGSADVDVAKWSITDDIKDNTTVSVGTFSPNMSGYGDGATVSNSTVPTAVMTLTNNGEVDATVTFSMGAASFLAESGDPVAFSGSKEYSWAGSAVAGDHASEEQVKARFSVALYFGAESTWDSAYLANGIALDSTQVTLAKGQSITVFMVVTWTTPYENDSASKGELCDAIDTWIGQNVASIAYEVSFKAVQAETISQAA